MATLTGWLYTVLTFSPKNCPTAHDTYVYSGTFFNRLRGLMTRKWGKLAYVGTVEAHVTSRRAHLNLAIHNRAMLNYCKVEGCYHAEKIVCHIKETGETCSRRYCLNCRGRGYRYTLCAGYRKLRRELREMVVRAGFGENLWLEPVQKREAIADYMVKLSMELADGGEKVSTTGQDQIPVEAPKHFRRLRASRGLLPPPHKNPEITGKLLQMPVEHAEMVERLEEDRRLEWMNSSNYESLPIPVTGSGVSVGALQKTPDPSSGDTPPA